MNHHPNLTTPSAVRGGGILPRLARLFRAKSPDGGDPPLKTPPVGLSEILLPQARSRWLLPQAATLTPARIENILRCALTGDSPVREQELYSLMEATWPRLLKNRMEVVENVLSLDWNLMAPPEAEGIAGAKALIERCKNGMKGDPVSDGNGWRATLASLLDAWFRGVSIVELDWEYRGGRKFPMAWLPRQSRDVPPWHFGWNLNGRLMFYPEENPSRAVDFPANRFLIAIRKAGKGHPSGTALLRCLAWFWCSANFCQEWLLNFAQLFGQPFRWATYDPAQTGVKEEVAAMMEAMGSAAWAAVPNGTKMEFHESGKSGADNPQAYMLTLADTACDLLLLGQTLTGSVGDSGSRALGEVDAAGRSDIIDAAALWLAEVLNEQLVPAVIALNYGDFDEDSALPWFQPTRKSKKDTKVIAETFEIVLRSGIPLLKEEVYDALDMSQPEAGAEVFSGPSNPMTPPLTGKAAEMPPELRRMLAKLPLDAREYFLARWEG